MDPALFFALDSLNVGDISEPSFVQLGPNSTAIRILYFKKDIPPHKANLKDDYEKLKNATTQMKRGEKRNEYLNEKIQEVYIEIDPEYNRCGIINNN
jgi:peptidyl-prolyl cis-trans isomerase SurA